MAKILKYVFKGPWDATGKIVKSTIIRNELANWQCANVFACYAKFKAQVAMDGTESKTQKLLEWELSNNEKVLINTTFKPKRTLIGLAIETQELYDRMKSDSDPHIVLTDRSIPIEDMKAVPSTLSLFSV